MRHVMLETVCYFVSKTTHWTLINLSFMLPRRLGKGRFSFMSNGEVKGVVIVCVMQLRVKPLPECY